MPSFSNPTEIARETFRMLASRRIAPTRALPDGHHEVAGTRAEDITSFPESELKSLQQSLPRDLRHNCVLRAN